MIDKDVFHAVSTKLQGVSSEYGLSGTPGSHHKTHNIRDMLEMPPFPQKELDSRKLLYTGTPNHNLLNSFRDLRTKLLQHSKGNNFVCLVSSFCFRGGSSFVAANLAIAFALDQAKASLIVDGNLYNPSVDRLLTGDADAGLTDFLFDPTLDVKDIIYASGIPRLRVIPVGSKREDGAEYFASARMRRFVDEIKHRYPDRFVFIDAPPVMLSAETQILSELCDMVVLVVPYGGTTAVQVAAGIDEIGKEKLAGLIFNS